MTSLKQEIYDLLKTWCDGLVRYQITEINDSNLKGGILCPACSIIHGRCGNAIPAMLFLAEQEEDKKYIRCAEGLIDWSEQLLCPDGGFVNDTESEWKGITTFAFISLCDAYFGYGHMLSEEYREKLYHQVTATLDYLVHTFDYHSGNINYMMAEACALDKAGICFKNASYREKAAEIYEEFSYYFTENNLIYGEGAHKWDEVSEKGCRPVDVGYSVEEILNHLVLYGVSSGNEKVLEQAQRCAESYLHFFLPDGGWDNSFGTRMDKWTYWGSRTSDGCQPAFFILGKRNPALAYVAYQNMQYLKQCTYNGLLYGGRDVEKRGEPPCVHHAFTHVNGLLTSLEWLEENELPEFRNQGNSILVGSKYFPELNVYVHNRDGFRATISALDLVTEKENCTPRGGALTLLYHEKVGILCAASMTVYKRFELQNTQRHREDVDTPLTPRLEYRNGKELFSNLQDLHVKVTKISEDSYYCEGCICDENGAYPFENEIHYTIQYTFTENELYIEYTHTDEERRLDFHFPVISEDGVRVECSAQLERNEKRIFNHVPGFEATDYYIENAPQKFTLQIKID
ncbi:MAG: hypothetical protein IJE60_11695 [Tyzzerella sp.]|nr:hypothetical protein [Tyzzerella sp.]